MSATGLPATGLPATDLCRWFHKYSNPDPASNSDDLSESWTTKHTCLFGVDASIKALRAWVRSYLDRVPGTPKGVLLLGPTGVGKTTAAYRVLREFELNVVERNASTVRTRKAMEDDILHTVASGYPNALLIEDVDTIVAGAGGLETILRLVNPTRGLNRSITGKDREQAAMRWTIPIVCTANTSCTRNMTDLSSDSLTLAFDRIELEDLMALYARLVTLEPRLSSAVSAERAHMMATKSSGDARQFVQALEYATRAGGVSASLDRELTPTEQARIVMESQVPVSEVARMTRADPMGVTHVVQENYLASPALGLHEAYGFARVLSESDLFSSRQMDAYGFFAPAHAGLSLNPSGLPIGNLSPGTSWSKKSYGAARAKQCVRARHSACRMGESETVYALASALQGMIDSADYESALELCVSYGLDFAGLEAVLRVQFRYAALKQRHKSVLKKRLLALAES